MSEITSMWPLQASSKKIIALLEKLPPNKVQEWLDFGDFLVSRFSSPREKGKLGDRFAGAWEDERSAEEIITDIRSSRMENVERESL